MQYEKKLKSEQCEVRLAQRDFAELKSRGVEFTDQISDAGYGLTIHFKMPSDFTVELYQPHYTKNTK